MTDRYTLVWGDNLCRHGCGRVVRPGNRFINGHDTQLLDILLDAHKIGALILRADQFGPPIDTLTPTEYAEQAFYPQGFRWYLIKARISAPAPEELAGAGDPILSHLDLGTAEWNPEPAALESATALRELLTLRVEAAGRHLHLNRYHSDANEVLDLLKLCRREDPVYLDAVRLLLGLEKE
ncbi:MAG: hypothetical protein WC054_00210 [Candidatus Nanopelagicales bacterium]